ncbi:MAG: recombinase family protein [Endomicrobia bacterium]|nr:recombinase family protein [Endomicrobiia bacterium]
MEKEQAILFLRVSSRGQEDNYSLDAQERLGRAYADKNNLRIVKFWKVAESAWGKKERKNFNQMLEYAKNNPQIKHIIFDILDRMTRNDFDKIRMRELMVEHGKTFHFSRTNKTYNKNYSSDDEFMLDIEVAVAKKWSNDISRKVKMGHLESAEQGHYPHFPPVGYKRDDSRKIIKDEVFAPLVSKLYDLVIARHYSLTTITQMLYDLGLRNPHKGCHNKKRMKLTSLKEIIENPFYYGNFIWKKNLYEGKHEPLISKVVWDKANAVLQGEDRPYNKDEVDYYFTGLLKCSECGSSISGAYTIKNKEKPEKAKKYRYYRCRRQKNHEIKGYIRENYLADKALLSVVKGVHIPKNATNVIQTTIDLIAGKQGFMKQNKRETLQAEYNDSLKQMDRLYELYSKGAINNVEIFANKEKELNETIIRLKGELALCNTDEKKTVEKAKALFLVINELEQLYTESNYEDKSLIIKELCGVSVLKGNKVIPEYLEPFNIIRKIPKAVEECSPTASDVKLLEDAKDFKSYTEKLVRAREESNL